MRVRTLSSLALGGVPLEQWNALDDHVQQILFPAELRRAVGRFQRAVLKRRSRRRAAFARALADQEKRRMTPQSVTVTKADRDLLSCKLLKGDHVMVLFEDCTHHGIVVCRTAVNDVSAAYGVSVANGVSVAELGVDGRVRVVDLEAFLRRQKTLGIVRYEEGDENETRGWDASRASRMCTVDLATRMTRMHPEDLRAYDLMRQTPRCFAWACRTGHLWCGSQRVQRVLDAIDDCMRKATSLHVGTFDLDFGCQCVRDVAPMCAIM